VNFKSKLLEWTQKNRVRMEYKAIRQSKDESGSPVFECVVLIEGVEGCKGRGYSKKESHQQASKDTLLRLRREPQFIDAIFAAKTERTKMEEEPVQVAPCVEQPDDFIIASPLSSPVEQTTPSQQDADSAEPSENVAAETPAEKTREDIIAEAEAAAFADLKVAEE